MTTNGKPVTGNDEQEAEEIMDLSSAQVLERTSEEDEAEFGRYRTLVRVGRGGMAEVFVAIARGPAGFNKLSVIKRLHSGMAEDEGYREMFLEEARLAARLNHPNVVQTYEVSEHNGIIFIAMEYLEGQPLNRLTSALAKREQSVSQALYVRMMCDVLSGLHYAHELRDFNGTPLKVVHRDVSPQNIFITYEGQVKVLDFGIAKAECSSTKTQAGVLKGKAGYMAPEQLMTDGIDRRVDVFTAGVVLWELLTGKRLMSSSSTAKTLVKLLNDPIPRVSEVVPSVDARLDQIVAKALERKPEDRYATALDMRDALEQYLATIAHSGTARFEDLGRLMTSLFAEDRKKLDQEIREQLAAVSVQPMSGQIRVGDIDGEPLGNNVTTSMVKLSTNTGSHRSSFTGIGVTRRSPPMIGLGSPSANAPGERSMKRTVALVGGAILLLVAGVSVVQGVRRTPAAASAGEPTSPVVVSTIVTSGGPVLPPSAAVPIPETTIAARTAAKAEPKAPPAVVVRRAPSPPAPEPKGGGGSGSKATNPAPQAASAAAPAQTPSAPPSAAEPQAPRAAPAPAAPAPNEGRKFRISL